MTKRTVVIIGAGAAGFFGAIACAESNPDLRVIILEKTRQVLSKVRISGGGRCNVTHACFDPAILVQNYPRGHKELRNAFARFQPRDTMQWFKQRDVELKIEDDGRVFPCTDNSETIIACLMREQKKLGIELWTEKGVTDCRRDGNQYVLDLSNGQTLHCDALLVAAGGNSKVHQWLEKLGHTWIAPVSSLFTFNIPDPALNALSGISVPEAKVSLDSIGLQQSGPLLITHWGLSGPAILKLSAWGARDLHECQYRTTLTINWLPHYSTESIKQLFDKVRREQGHRLVSGDPPMAFPKNLWKYLLVQCKIPVDIRWSMLSKQQISSAIAILQAQKLAIEGKSTYKDEFVTCGGIKLQEVNFQTMESKICPKLYFAGEILNVDGVTGGFNFQNAWTTAWIAGKNI